MDDLLFRILAVAATAGFLIGILCGWWPFFLVSILLVRAVQPGFNPETGVSRVTVLHSLTKNQPRNSYNPNSKTS